MCFIWGLVSVIKSFLDSQLHNKPLLSGSLTHFIGQICLLNSSMQGKWHVFNVCGWHVFNAFQNCIFISRLFLLLFYQLLVTDITRSLQRPWGCAENLFLLCDQTLRSVCISSSNCEMMLYLFLTMRMTLLCRVMVSISDRMFIPYIMVLCRA